MSFRPTHELHKRRFSRNLGLGLVLAGFIALVFALTVVKVQNIGQVPKMGSMPAQQPQGGS